MGLSQTISLIMKEIICILLVISFSNTLFGQYDKENKWNTNSNKKKKDEISKDFSHLVDFPEKNQNRVHFVGAEEERNPSIPNFNPNSPEYEYVLNPTPYTNKDLGYYNQPIYHKIERVFLRLEKRYLFIFCFTGIILFFIPFITKTNLFTNGKKIFYNN